MLGATGRQWHRVFVAGAALAAVLSLALPAGAAARPGVPAHTLGDTPRLAPIVFLPGLVASEISCGTPATGMTNLWPTTATSLLTSSIPISALGLVDTVAPTGAVTSRTTSSPQCGSAPYGAGTAAADEPVPVSALWCAPEYPGAISPTPHPCAVPGAGTGYDPFGLALQHQIAADGRGQKFVSYAWDWRKPPSQQVAGLDQLITQLSSETGQKVTVVAHSFGNTLFRTWIRYVEKKGTEGTAGQRVGRYLAVAPGWWGTPTAWTHGAYGEIQPTTIFKIVDLGVGIATIQDAFSSMPGPYWILPDKSYDDYLAAQTQTSGQSWLAAREHLANSSWVPFATVPGVAATQLNHCPQATVFPCQPQAMYNAAVAGSPSSTFGPDGIATFSEVAGSGVATPGQVCTDCIVWPTGGTTGTRGAIGQPVHSIRDTNGDGNVPLFSALQGSSQSPSPEFHYYFACGVHHMGLMENQDVVDQTVPFLTGDAPLAFNTTLHAQPCAIGSAVATVSVTPSSGTIPFTASFDGSASTDANPITGYSWTFGDGHRATGEKVTHVYTRAGTFKATLTVSDAQGGSATSYVTITATAAPVVTGQAVVGVASDPATGGYWEVGASGTVYATNAPFYGSMAGQALNQPIVGIAATPDGGGYWEVAADGGIFSFGDAPFYGSMGGRPLNQPIVGIAATPDGGGYWEVAADGGIFSFGDAPFYGSMGGRPLNAPVVAVVAAPGGGYWEAAADGGIFAFGAAPFLGSEGGSPLASSVVGAAPTATGGYLTAAASGAVAVFAP